MIHVYNSTEFYKKLRLIDSLVSDKLFTDICLDVDNAGNLVAYKHTSHAYGEIEFDKKICEGQSESHLIITTTKPLEFLRDEYSIENKESFVLIQHDSGKIQINKKSVDTNGRLKFDGEFAQFDPTVALSVLWSIGKPDSIDNTIYLNDNKFLVTNRVSMASARAVEAPDELKGKYGILVDYQNLLKLANGICFDEVGKFAWFRLPDGLFRVNLTQKPDICSYVIGLARSLEPSASFSVSKRSLIVALSRLSGVVDLNRFDGIAFVVSELGLTLYTPETETGSVREILPVTNAVGSIDISLSLSRLKDMVSSSDTEEITIHHFISTEPKGEFIGIFPYNGDAEFYLPPISSSWRTKNV